MDQQPTMQPAMPAQLAVKLSPLFAVVFQHRQGRMYCGIKRAAQLREIRDRVTRIGDHSASIAAPKKRPDFFGKRLFQRLAAGDRLWDPLESTCRHASLSIL